MDGSPSRFEDFFNAQNEVQVLFTHVLEAILGDEGITVPQALTLKALKERGERCRMSDLAASCFHSPAAMTGIVDRMIHMGLVERGSDERDRRVILLSLTALGMKKLAEVDDKIQHLMRRFFEGTPEKDRAASLRISTRLKDFLKDEINAKKKT